MLLMLLNLDQRNRAAGILLDSACLELTAAEPCMSEVQRGRVPC
jgi:hypothetical protein